MRIAGIIFCLLVAFNSVAQKQSPHGDNKDELLAKRKQIQASIDETERQLELLRSGKKTTAGQLAVLQHKLAERQNLIININEELGAIENNIATSSKEVTELNDKLQKLKTSYAQSVRYAYATRGDHDMLACLFASKGYTDATRRLKYMKTVRESRQHTADEIYHTEKKLQHKMANLDRERREKNEVLDMQQQQQRQLKNETDQVGAVMRDLKGKETDLAKRIKRDKASARRVDNMIARVIDRGGDDDRNQDEDKRSKWRTRKERRGRTTTERHDPVSTPTDLALANSFQSSKGQLYWPVERGVITGKYGEHPYPGFPNLKIYNSGIDIQTTMHASVRAVFDGVVTLASVLDGVKTVIVQHGSFYTVYRNLSRFAVTKGDHIKLKDAVGTVANDDDGNPTINFQVWTSGARGTTTQNPELWLGK